MSALVRLCVAVVTAGALVTGCAGTGPDALAGRTFISTGFSVGDDPRDLAPGTRLAIGFGGDGRLTVNAGCNTMSGSYRIDGGVLHVAGGATTEMGCDAARQAQDEWLFAFIGSGPIVTLTGIDLTLTAGDTVVRLIDREIAEPDQPLVGPSWTVESIIAGDAVSSAPGGVVATLRFTDDGRVEVATGCNQGGGSYIVDGQMIRFGDVAMTEMACGGSAGEMEHAVVAVLGASSVSYLIDASTLTLDAGGEGLILRAP